MSATVVSWHRITYLGDRLLLDREYDGIINNFKTDEIYADKELITLCGKILDVIQRDFEL